MSSALHRQIAEILNLKPAQVERSLDDLSRQIRRHLSGNGEVAVEGLGVFRSVKGHVEFEPDPSVLAYVNSEFEGLKDLNLDPAGAYRVQEIISTAEDVPAADPGEFAASPAAPGESIERPSSEGTFATPAEQESPFSAEPEAETPSPPADTAEAGSDAATVEVPPPEETDAQAGTPMAEPAPDEVEEYAFDEERERAEGEEESEGSEQAESDQGEEEEEEEEAAGWVTPLPGRDPAASFDPTRGMEDVPFDVLPPGGREEEELAVLRALTGETAGASEAAQPDAGSGEAEDADLGAGLASVADVAAEADGLPGTEPASASGEPEGQGTEESASLEVPEEPVRPGRSPGPVDLRPVSESTWIPPERFERPHRAERPLTQRTSFRYSDEEDERSSHRARRDETRRRDRLVAWLGVVAAVALGISIFYTIVYWDAVYATLTGAQPAEEPVARVLPPVDHPAPADSTAASLSGPTESDPLVEQMPDGRIPERIQADERDALPPPAAEQAPSVVPDGLARADGDYAWIVGSLPNRNEAESLLGRYRAAGISGEVFEARVNGAITYRVAIGRYASVEQARASRSELPAFAPADAWVRNIRGN